MVSAALNSQAATTADVLFVVDESGSMSGEHAWIQSMVTALDTALMANGVTGNRYGLVGFGANTAHGIPGHKHTVGGGDFGSAAQLATAATGLVLSGSQEDGWSGIDVALNGYTLRGNAAVNVILITDEDRDNAGNSLTYSSVLASLDSKNAYLNSVINGTFDPGVVLGVDSAGVAYVADGGGGYTATAPGTGFFVSGSGTTKANYVDLAWDTGGAAWDLNILRNGGNGAISFTKAFVDIKTQEILQHPTPEGGATLLLLGAGLCGIVSLRRGIAS